MIGQNDYTIATPAVGAMRVLVVDDYPDTCETTKSLLELKGHVVGTASSGNQAIREFSGFRPDLVLLDITMPDMDGIEVAQAIQRTPGIRKPVIAAMSGHSSLLHKRRCASAGFDYYLLKPVDPVAIDQLLWFEGSAIRNKFLTLKQQQVEISYDWMRAQLEFAGLMLDMANTISNDASKRDYVQKVQRRLERMAIYFMSTTGFSPSQMRTLQSSLRNLEIRFTTIKGSAQLET